jgi:MFS family permease
MTIGTRAATPAALTAVIASAQVFGMGGYASFAALMPVFMPEWRLADSEAGWINGVFYAGYLGAVPWLSSLTDRVAPRRVYIAASLISALASFGFAFAADGFWSAALFRFFAGIGLAGTYMPGLKLLADHVPGTDQSRMVAFYTAGFSIGSALSLFAAGQVEAALGWRAAFAVAGLGPLLAVALLQFLLPREDPRPHPPPATHVLDFRPVLRCREAMGYVLTYAIHNFEVFAARSWLVVYLAFAAALRPDQSAGWWAPATLAALFTLFGVPATIFGNELAIRFGRRRTIAGIMVVSAAVGLTVGFAPGWPYLIVVALVALHMMTQIGESAAVTAGSVAAAPAGYRGATMAVHSTLGFTGAFLGPVAFGFALEFAGGSGTEGAWFAAFALTAGVMLLGPFALRLARSAAPR